MSFVPQTVTPEYSLLMSRETFSEIKDLKFPRDKKAISRLNLTEKMVWYAAQDPQELITIDANTKRADAKAVEFDSTYSDFDEAQYLKRSAFSRFWFWHYLMPLRLKRALFWFKFW